MSGTRLAFLAVMMIALVALGTGELLAKKPSPPPPEPDPDPAIAYKTVERKADKLWVMNADGSNRTLLVTATSATISRADWSPDGDRLVFGSTMGGSPGIWVVDVDGTGLTRIVTTEVLTFPRWSPEGVPGVGGDAYRIAYTDRGTTGLQNDVYIVDVDGGNEEQLFETEAMEGKAAWSRCGTKLAFNISDDVGLWGSYDFSTDEYSVHEHGGTMADYRCFFPEWAKTQDDKIVWHLMMDGADRDIFVVDLDDPDDPVRLTSGGGVERYPSWSPDDSKIVFEVQDKKGKASIAVMSSADGSGRTTLLGGAGAPTWRR